MRKQDIQRLLSAALIEEEISKGRAEFERLKAQNDRLEKDVVALQQSEDPPHDLYSVGATTKATVQLGREARASSPESSNDIPSLPPLHDKHAMAKTGKRFYKRAMVTSMAPWQRPPSRGALKETARQQAKSKYIRNTNMLYYKSGEELGLETAGDKGAPTLNYDGKMLFPMNPRHPKAKPPNSRDDSSVHRPPFACDDSANDKDRFVNLGSVKPLFSSPYRKALTPRVVNNNNVSSASVKPVEQNDVISGGDAIDAFLHYRKQNDQVEARRRQSVLRESVHHATEHQVPKPPPEPELNKLGRARRRRQESMLKKYGNVALEKILVPKPPRRKQRYKVYNRAGRYDIHKRTNTNSERVRGIRRRRRGRETIFTEEEEYIEKEKSPRDAYNGMGSAPSTRPTDTDAASASDMTSFDDTASRISNIGDQMSKALKALSVQKRRLQHGSRNSEYAPSHASGARGYGRRNRRRGRY